tara:strand:+ start:1322 stop:2173 length:852 start_codon:yes stop_codon:yes gene_type:complete
MLYLQWVNKVTRNDYKLKHQRVEDGHVLFESEREVARLTLLVEHHNSGEKLPFEDGDYKGISIFENREHLNNCIFSNDDWYSAQCPSCAEAGKDNKMNNLQLSKNGFRCMAGCNGKDVLAAFEKLTPEVSVTEDITPGQTLDYYTNPEEGGIDNARLISTTEKKDRFVNVDELEGGNFSVTIFNKNKQTGETQKQQHNVRRSALRSIWVWITRNCPVHATVKSSEIREFLAEKHGVPAEAWASHAHRTIYFDTHYYPLTILAWMRLIEYHHNGSITRLKEEFE